MDSKIIFPLKSRGKKVCKLQCTVWYVNILKPKDLEFQSKLQKFAFNTL